MFLFCLGLVLFLLPPSVAPFPTDRDLRLFTVRRISVLLFCCHFFYFTTLYQEKSLLVLSSSLLVLSFSLYCNNTKDSFTFFELLFFGLASFAATSRVAPFPTYLHLVGIEKLTLLFTLL